MNNAMKMAMLSRGKDSRRDERRNYDWGDSRHYDRDSRRDYERDSRGYDRRDYGREDYGRENRHYDRLGGSYPMEYRSGYESVQDYRPRYGREEGHSRYRDEDDEDEYSFKIKGKFGMHDKPEKLTREMAEKWVANMDRADGRGKGGQWTMEQTNQLMKQKGFDFDPAVFYAVCNMLHSDYSKTLAKYGVSTPEAYAELARDWIEDDDVAAGERKTVCYYADIVK